MKKRKKRRLKWLALFTPILLPLAVLVMVAVVVIGGSGDSSSSSSGGASETTLSASEVAQKGGVSEERAKDVIAIFNQLVGKEGSTVDGASAVLAIAERESNFDPKAVNTGGGVAGYLQWSGWGHETNGNRWAQAPSRTLDSKTELELLDKELNGSYSEVKTYLQSAKDPGESALYFSEKYEGVSLSDGQTKADQLKKDAKKWKEVFKDSVKKSDSSGSPNGSGTVASSFDFPSEYKGKLKYGEPSSNTLTKMGANNYPAGQCTWYVCNRLQETGLATESAIYNSNGNGQDWVNSLVAKGWKRSDKPKEGAVMSTRGGYDETIADYGHVSFVEKVNSDGTFLVSECNYAGIQNKVHYRICTNQSCYSFAVK